MATTNHRTCCRAAPVQHSTLSPRKKDHECSVCSMDFELHSCTHHLHVCKVFAPHTSSRHCCTHSPPTHHLLSLTRCRLIRGTGVITRYIFLSAIFGTISFIILATTDISAVSNSTSGSNGSNGSNDGGSGADAPLTVGDLHTSLGGPGATAAILMMFGHLQVASRLDSIAHRLIFHDVVLTVGTGGVAYNTCTKSRRMEQPTRTGSSRQPPTCEYLCMLTCAQQ